MILDTAQDPTSSPDFDNFEYFAQSFELENVIEYQKVWYQNFSHIKLHQINITQKRFILKIFYIFFLILKKKFLNKKNFEKNFLRLISIK